ncbi:ABC transporter permease [Roseibium marinum]|uniref:Ribose transport system permease protein n=1 Tax=Roseibium marinum TaxID=281252 RepID=A0A2S3UN22_9HYPH|nr:SMP-30/gluconolactonase/LRE family protein [Roseibium marinum]POF29117.1 ribose transport system permease protein [Roseibium marinum]
MNESAANAATEAGNVASADPKGSTGEALVRFRYKWIPTHIFGELLSKPWIDNIVPATILLLVVAYFGSTVPNFFLHGNVMDGTRQIGELGFVVIGMMFVVVGGGIDLSVGSNFALGNILALALTNVFGLPVPVVFVAVVATCSFIGLINGILVGYFKLRAFLTTLVMLIGLRALVDTILLKYALTISAGYYDDDFWYFIGDGSVLGMPTSLALFLVMAVAMHMVLSRTRLGWHIMAVGGSRRSAHNAGISLNRTVCISYVICGSFVGVSAFFYAARLGNGGSYPGVGLEVLALTAVIVGGISLGGGRGSVVKAVIGTMIVQIISLGVVQAGLLSGAGQLVLGLILLAAIGFNVRWVKNQDKVLSRVYMSPTYFDLPAAPSTAQEADSPYASNDRLGDVEVIGLDQVDGAEDIVFDSSDNLFCGDRRGNIMRFDAPDYDTGRVFAHIGGHPLGMAVDDKDRIVVCVGGMGLYRVDQSANVEKLTDETNRSLFAIIDDSRLRLTDDCDIAPDGRIFFSEATIRFDMSSWPSDALESRASGRIVCYDPKRDITRTVARGLTFPNGITLSFDGQSILFAESWACRISRYWIEGPKAGKIERVVENLPGYPDNINRASDGTYWLALMGMRSPALDLALRVPGFRKRMSQEISNDEWLYPNLNTGCIVRFTEDGQIIESLWDKSGENHPMITSMREHKGRLYIGGIFNNRIGSLKLKSGDPNWTGPASYWGKA